MAWTSGQLTALEMAIALGVLEVEYPDGTRKRYRDQAEMLALRNQMRVDLGLVKKSTARRFATFSKGLDS